MTWVEILTGIGAVLTTAIGVVLIVRELHRRERRTADRQIDKLSEQVHLLRTDFLAYHGWAFGLARRMMDAGLEVPSAPEPHDLAEAEDEEEDPRGFFRRRKVQEK